MGYYNELPVYKATYDLLVEMFRFTRNFSREYKYTVTNSGFGTATINFAIGSAIIAGAGVYFNVSADATYDEYANATDNNICTDARAKYENQQKCRDISYTVSLAPLVYSLYNLAKMKGN